MPGLESVSDPGQAEREVFAHGVRGPRQQRSGQAGRPLRSHPNEVTKTQEHRARASAAQGRGRVWGQSQSLSPQERQGQSVGAWGPVATLRGPGSTRATGPQTHGRPLTRTEPLVSLTTRPSSFMVTLLGAALLGPGPRRSCRLTQSWSGGPWCWWTRCEGSSAQQWG